eukprot:5666740-Amphidinium_carterae.1
MVFSQFGRELFVLATFLDYLIMTPTLVLLIAVMRCIIIILVLSPSAVTWVLPILTPFTSIIEASPLEPLAVVLL